MWARKRIDIPVHLLAERLLACILSSSPYRPETAPGNSITASCFGARPILPCLSVRSGFDLLLQSIQQITPWPTNSEIIFSGLTIPDLPRIAREHSLVPIGTNLNIHSMAPTVQDIETKITPNTQAIVIAHLMGGRVNLEQFSGLARQHDLLLIEDCAQSFTGQPDDASTFSDVAMFSFGAIKTNTALGGAAIIVKDKTLMETMRWNQRQWPTQSKWIDLKRITKYLTLVKPISSWLPAMVVRKICKTFGCNHDLFAAGMARGFAEKRFFKLIRHQPSPNQIRFLNERLNQFDTQTIKTRIRRANLLIETILSNNPELDILGRFSDAPTHWVFAIAAENPDPLVQLLWDNGFDATRQSSLRSVDPSNLTLDKILKRIVFLPIDLPMPERELVRMGNLVGQLAIPCTWDSVESNLDVSQNVGHSGSRGPH